MALTEEDLKQVGTYVQAHLFEWLPANIIDLSERATRIEERLEKQQALMEQGFHNMEKRFEQVDKRFDDVNERFKEQREDMNARFESVDKRFDDMHRHTNRWMTVLTVMLGVIGVAVTVTNLV